MSQTSKAKADPYVHLQHTHLQQMQNQAYQYQYPAQQLQQDPTAAFYPSNLDLQQPDYSMLVSSGHAQATGFPHRQPMLQARLVIFNVPSITSC